MKNSFVKAGLLLLGTLMLGMVGRVQAQDKLEDDPGYVDLRGVEDWFDTGARLEVNVKGALLNLVAEASRYEDPELAELLLKLKAIQVRGYPLERVQLEAVEQHAERMAERLEGGGWDTVVRVRDYDERVDMYVKVVEGAIAGMVVMVVSPAEEESVFVNIVGEIDPEQIGRIGRKFDIGHLDDRWK
jgi:hypothetical protein